MAPKPVKVDGIFSAKNKKELEAKIVEEKITDKAEKRKPKRAFIIFRNVLVSLSILLLFSAILAGSVFAQQKIYTNKVFPGVVVWGIPVGGKTVDQVQQALTEKIKSFNVNVKGPDQSYAATSDDLGVIFNTETIALSAYSKGRTSSLSDNILTRIRLLVAQIDWKPLQKIVRNGDLDLAINYSVDEAKLTEYVNKVSNNVVIKPQDSQVLVENGMTKLVPAVFGREVDIESLKSDLKNSIKSLKKSEVVLKTSEVKPNVIDKEAEEVRIQTESVISRPVILAYQGQEFRPNKETVSSWISYTKTADAKTYTLVIDQNKMASYLSFIDSKISNYSTPKKVRVENGAKETVTQEGKDGLVVDKKSLSKQIAEDLPTMASVNLVVPMYVDSFKTEYEQILVADWSKYIEINLETQTMTAYEQGGNVVGSWKVTTGNRYHPTPAGTWLVHGKSAVTRMTGGTPGIDYYDLPNVHWVTWFKGGGYSIHEAYWRTSFGGSDYVWNGSHGCVNSPIDVAKFIYDWAPIGTPVIVH